MYDLCTRTEQPPEPESEQPVSAVDTDMERSSRGEAEAPGQQNREKDTTTEEQQYTTSTNGDLMDKANLDRATVTPTALLGERHHSLYEDLNGWEVERFRKVSPGLGYVVMVYL